MTLLLLLPPTPALHFFSEFHTQYCCHPFNLKLNPSTSQPMHFREIFRKSSHHVKTNKGSIFRQSDNDVEGYRSQKVLFQPNVGVFLQYSVSVTCCLYFARILLTVIFEILHYVAVARTLFVWMKVTTILILVFNG